MKNTIYTLLLSLISATAISQTETDVFRYSNTQIGGTARFNSLAGAFGAVGADFSVVSTNPAGLGRYRASEFSFTPLLNLNKTTSVHNEYATRASKEALGINNISLVVVNKENPESPYLWRAVQFGFGYTKLANFHERYKVESVDSNSYSLVLADQGYAATEEQLWNGTVSPFMAAPAYNAWLIDPLNGTGGKEIFTTQMYVDSIQTKHYVERKGSIGEWSFAASGNYNDKFYIGASLNFSKLKMSQVKTHQETSLIDTTSLIDFTIEDSLQTTGKGANLRLGAIFLPVKWLRLGIAVHTPTFYYNMQDKWSSNITTNFRDTNSIRDQRSYTAYSPQGSFLYKMRTPGKVIGSLAFVFKKRGMISVDYEMVNFQKGKLLKHPESGDGYDFDLENKMVDSNFVAVSNIRIGAEYRITNLWMLRGGVAYYGNGHNPQYVTEANPIMTYAGGVGYRSRNFYVDVAYTLTKTVRDYYMYDPILVSNTQIFKKSSNFMATVGFKF